MTCCARVLCESKLDKVGKTESLAWSMEEVLATKHQRPTTFMTMLACLEAIWLFPHSEIHRKSGSLPFFKEVSPTWLSNAKDDAFDGACSPCS
jgi:hypothetical protein